MSIRKAPLASVQFLSWPQLKMSMCWHCLFLLLTGQASSASSQPQRNSEQPNKPRRKPKGKGTGDHPPEQAQCDSSTSKGGKTGGKGKSVVQGQPKQQAEEGGRGSGKASKPKPTEQPQKGAGKGKPDADGWVQVRRKAADEDFRLLSQDWDKPLLEFGRLADTLDALQPDKILGIAYC